MMKPLSNFKSITRWFAISAILAFLLLSKGPAESISAAPTAGTISGTVFRDFDSDGVFDATEPGIAGITVTAVDNLGNTSSVTTSNTGTYATASLGGTSARIEFTLPVNGSLDFLSPSVAGGTTVQFIDISAGNVANVNAGFLNPAQYSIAAPQVVVPYWERGDQSTNNNPVISGHAYTANGTGVALNPYANASQVGTIFGLAYQTQSGVLFGGTYIRRGSGVGSTNTTGAIYKISGTGAPAAFLDLTNIVTTGANPHPNGAGHNFTLDTATYPQVGKIGLGDLEISDDEETLYAVNLHDRELVIMPLTFDSNGQPVAPASVDISTVTIPIPTTCDDTGLDPNEPDATDWRPFALKFFDGKLYVGGVCTAASMIAGLDPATATFTAVQPFLQYLDAHIYVFDPVTNTFNTTPILSIPLDYEREALDAGFTVAPGQDNDAEWLPWTDHWLPNWRGRNTGGFIVNVNPQPMLVDIEFDGRGFMFIGLRDRFGDQAYDDGDPGPYNATPTTRQRMAGDLLLACLDASGAWQLESGLTTARTCTNGLTGETRTATNPNSPDYNLGSPQPEFFHEDQYRENGTTSLYHDETFLGTLATLYGSGQVVGTKFDAMGIYEGGTVTYNTANGNRVRAVQMYPPNTHFGKAGGLGDIELLGTAAPIEVGNRVWQDNDGDGIQDPAEPAISGVTVSLYDTTGTQLATTTTNGNGLYYFSNIQTVGTVAAQVTLSGNDAEQLTNAPGTTTINGTDLDIGNNNAVGTPYHIGLRFTALAIPAGATITSAYIQFATDSDGPNNIGATATFNIEGQLIADAPAFTATNNNVTGRARTVADVNWSTPTWTGTGIVGFSQKTADLATVVQEIVSLPGWASGNDMVFIINNSADHREAETFDGVAANAPRLIINYTVRPATFVNLQYRSDYEIRVNLNQAPLNGFSPATPDNDATSFGDLRDSDGQNRGGYVAANFTTSGPGDNNHSLDFGFVPRLTLGDKVWNDEDNDGQYDLPVRIGDFVWYDLDNDGLQDSNETGVNGVRVMLHRSTDADCTTPALALTTTAPNGSYLFDNLAPANYFVCFDLTTLPAGFAPTTANVGGDDTIDSDANASGQTAATGVMAAGQQNMTLDMGIISNGSVAVGDHVWYDTDRDGVQDAGETMGVPGVRVALYTNGQTCGVNMPTATTVTDNNGYYLFAGLPVGNYFVCFDLTSLPTGYQVTTQNAGGNDALDSDANPATGATASTGAMAINMANMSLDMGIRATNATTNSLGDKVWYDQNRDGDQDGTAEPGAPAVRVELHLNGENCTDTPLAVTTTNSLGIYSFAGLPDGNYFVCFDLTTLPTGYQVTTPDLGGDDTQDSDANQTTGQTPSVALAGGTSNTTLDMGIRRTDAGKVAVGDRVWLDADRDGVQDAGELGVPGIRVDLYQNGQSCMSAAANGGYTASGTASEWEHGMVPTTLWPNACAGGSGQCWGTDLEGAYSNTSNQNVQSVVMNIPATATAPISVNWDQAFDLGTGDSVTAQYRCNAGAWTNMFTSASTTTTAWANQNQAATCTAGQTLEVRFNLTSDAGTTDDGYYIDNVRVTDATATVLYVEDFETTFPVAGEITDANGDYLFTNLPTGNYFSCFALADIPAGFETTLRNVGADDTADSDALNTMGNTASTGVMAIGTANLTLDMGIRATIASPVSVGDYVWYDHDGDGTQDTGESGVAGVKVTLYAAATNRALATTTTGPDGLYLFTGLPSASYYVIFDLTTVPAGFTVTTQDVGADTSDSDANPTTGQTAATGVIAAGGSNTTLDMGIRPAGTVRLGDRVWLDRDADGRQDEGEPGAPGVTVNLYRQGQSCTDRPLGTTVTNQNGNYQFANLAPGNYFVCFDLTTVPPGFTPTTANNQTDDGVDSDPDSSGRTVPTGNLTAGQINMTLDMGLISTGNVTIGNYVWFDDNINGLQDTNEAGVTGVNVRLYRNGQTCGVDMPLAVTTTNSAGAYLFTGLPAGSYFVCFDLTTLPASYAATTQNVGGDDTLDSDANVTTGATAATASLPIGGSDLTLDMGIRPTIGAGLIAIGDRVWYDDNRNGQQDAGENGVPGVTVSLQTVGQTCADPDLLTTTTNSNGYYLFNNHAPGNRFVCFNLATIPSGYVVTLQDATGNDGNDSDANPTTGQTGNTGPIPANSANLTMDMGIYAPLHELPLAGVTVQIYAAAATCGVNPFLTQVTTDANGNYVFPNLPAGDYYVHISASNFTPGQALEYMISSTGNDPAPDPDADPANTDDNGTMVVSGACNGGVSSPTVTLTVNTEPTNDGTTDPNTPDPSHNLTVDFGLFEPMCIGDLVWFDADNSGTVNGGEYGLNGVLLNLYRDVNGNNTFEPGGADGASIANTTTAQVGGVDGSYSFCSVPKGSYFIQIPNTEFQAGDLLYQASSSTANNDPETTVVEDDDNGTDGGNAGTNGIASVFPVTLAVRTEPTADNNTNDNGRRDASTNQTVDLGLFAQMDYGDLPTTYNKTIFGENGPRHPNTGLSLGTLWDADNDGQESAAATGDDTTDGNDDEDGITVNSTTWGLGTGSIDVTAITGGSGCLVGWADYNGDGDFGDDIADGNGAAAPERLFISFVSGAGTINFATPNSTDSGGTFVYPATLNMRYRLFPANDAVFAAAGLTLDGNGCPATSNTTAQMATISMGGATGGEVEDYQQAFGPTAISLRHLAVNQPTGLWFVLGLLVAAAVSTTFILRRRNPLA